MRECASAAVAARHAPVAQPDRVVASEAIGRGFESLRARHTLGAIEVGIPLPSRMALGRSPARKPMACSRAGLPLRARHAPCCNEVGIPLPSRPALGRSPPRKQKACKRDGSPLRARHSPQVRCRTTATSPSSLASNRAGANAWASTGSWCAAIARSAGCCCCGRPGGDCGWRRRACRRLWPLFVFTLGVWLTRSAGCVINDYADRWLDPQVERTGDRWRPGRCPGARRWRCSPC
jgi:hypothetical protein